MEQKLLIVDDEAHIRMLIEQTLEELEDSDVEFLTADNGEKALEIINNEKPDLVFLDVMMPKMNGMEVCRRVKKDLALNNVYVILLTAKGQELDRQKGQEGPSPKAHAIDTQRSPRACDPRCKVVK